MIPNILNLRISFNMKPQILHLLLLKIILPLAIGTGIDEIKQFLLSTTILFKLLQ